MHKVPSSWDDIWMHKALGIQAGIHYSLNSLKQVIKGIISGSIIGVMKGILGI